MAARADPALVVDDARARLPIVVDPLISEIVDDASSRPNQAAAFARHRVPVAGDVNGDGYDDVIVGAPGYDAGQTTKARRSSSSAAPRASRTAIPRRAATQLESNQVGASSAAAWPARAT